jgi:hypothetical protein
MSRVGTQDAYERTKERLAERIGLLAATEDFAQRDRQTPGDLQGPIRQQEQESLPQELAGVD